MLNQLANLFKTEVREEHQLHIASARHITPEIDSKFEEMMKLVDEHLADSKGVITAQTFPRWFDEVYMFRASRVFEDEPKCVLFNTYLELLNNKAPAQFPLADVNDMYNVANTLFNRATRNAYEYMRTKNSNNIYVLALHSREEVGSIVVGFDTTNMTVIVGAL